MVIKAGDAGHNVFVGPFRKALGYVDCVPRFSFFVQGENHQASFAPTKKEMPSQADCQGEDGIAQLKRKKGEVYLKGIKTKKGIPAIAQSKHN